LPGGGQAPIAGAAAPPPPPPADPDPVVAERAVAAPVAVRHRVPSLTRGLPERVDRYVLPQFEVEAWLGGAVRPAEDRPADVRVAFFASLWRVALRELVDALALNFALQRPSVVGLGGGSP
jgi:hypothetical protein